MLQCPTDRVCFGVQKLTSRFPDGAARSPHPSLGHRRDRERELALQEPRLSAVLMTGIS